MECGKIKEFLSEYVDGSLDGQKKKLVEKHLSTCKNCSEEVRSLRAYLKAFSSLEEVEAPGDFLQKVHQRIQKRRGFQKVMQKLFIPLRIKVPLGLAGAAVTAMFIVYIFNAMQPVSKIERAPSLAGREEIAKKKTLEKVGDLDIKEGKTDLPSSTTESLLVSQLEEGWQKPIELALLIGPEVAGGVYLDANGHVGVKAKPERLNRDRRAKERVEAERAVVARIGEKAELGRGDDTYWLQYSNEILRVVSNLIESVKGKVISVQYEKETNLPRFISAEVPAKNYAALLEKLGQVGELQKPLPSIAAEGEELLQLRIKLISS